MLLLALSCLQGRPMQSAAEDLLALGADGLQLTAGCSPTPAFAAWVAWRSVPTRTHHGFSWVAARRTVWEGDALVGRADSVHPPIARQDFRPWLDAAVEQGTTVEVMYPGYLLGRGDEVDAAMAAGLPLAVDVSHLGLQQHAGVLSDRTLQRLLDYPNVQEVHVSSNDGRADRHWPVDHDSYGLDWARERRRDGLPVVCESYLHRVDDTGRRRLMDVLHDRLAA